MAIEEQSLELPRFISVDDHVVEPHGLWQERLPDKHKEQGPRVERVKGQVVYSDKSQPSFIVGDGPDDRWCDVWHYEETRWPMHAAFAAVGPTANMAATTALTYDDLLPGCFDQAHRLADMDAQPHRRQPVLPDRPPLLRPAVLEPQGHGARPAVCAGLQRLDDRGLVRGRRGRAT
jgi:hypothetical protein